MRELIGTMVIVLAVVSYFGFADVSLCLHTNDKSHCTKQRAQAQEGQQQ